jgi:hypothetical protein
MLTYLILIFLAQINADSDRILLKNVPSIILYPNTTTAFKRSQPVQQLICNSGCNFIPSSVTCRNIGTLGEKVLWNCIPSGLLPGCELINSEMSCEGYDYEQDPYVVNGSCGIIYDVVCKNKNTSTPTSIKAFIIAFSVVLTLLVIVACICVVCFKKRNKSEYSPIYIHRKFNDDNNKSNNVTINNKTYGTLQDVDDLLLYPSVPVVNNYPTYSETQINNRYDYVTNPSSSLQPLPPLPPPTAPVAPFTQIIPVNPFTLPPIIPPTPIILPTPTVLPPPVTKTKTKTVTTTKARIYDSNITPTTSRKYSNNVTTTTYRPYVSSSSSNSNTHHKSHHKTHHDVDTSSNSSNSDHHGHHGHHKDHHGSNTNYYGFGDTSSSSHHGHHGHHDNHSASDTSFSFGDSGGHHDSHH